MDPVVRLPFDLAAREYNKLPKLPGLTNWTFKCNKKREYRLVLEYWVATGPAQYKGDYIRSGGHGVVAGVRSNVAQKFEKRDITVAEIHYDESVDSWIFSDLEGKYYRAPWANAFQNPNYPHHKSRDEVTTILRSCSKLIIS